ncbi:hypothetical protein Tco_0764409 [Tanacetum coccineum]
MKEQAYNIIKTKDSRTQRQSNLKKFKEARFKISPQEFEDHTSGEIVSLKYVYDYGSSKFAGYLLKENSLRGRLHNHEALSLYDLSTTCHSKDIGPLPGLYLCWIVLRYRCIWTELITPNLICPSTYQLLRSSGGDSEPDPSFDKSASPERSFSFSPCCFGRILRVSMEMTGAKVQEEPHHDIRPTLQRLPFYYTPPVVIDAVIPDPTLSALAQSFGSTTRPILFMDNSDDKSDDDGDACIEIPLVTLIRSAAVIPSSGNQGKSSAAPVAEGSITRDFFPFSVGPHYATYPEGGVARNYEFTREEWDAPYQPTFGVLTKEVFKDPAICKTVMDQLPTPREMVRVESLSNDQLTGKMSVLHCMLMSHGGELLDRYRGLLQSHHEQVFGLNDNLYSSDASFAKSKAKRKERKKKIKSLTKSLDNLHAEVARLSAGLNRATILEAKKDEEILRLKATPPEFASFFRG